MLNYEIGILLPKEPLIEQDLIGSLLTTFEKQKLSVESYIGLLMLEFGNSLASLDVIFKILSEKFDSLSKHPKQIQIPPTKMPREASEKSS